MSREKHMIRSHRSYHNPKITSKDFAFHGNEILPKFSENNKNKNRMSSWEDRFGKWENKDE